MDSPAPAAAAAAASAVAPGKKAVDANKGPSPSNPDGTVLLQQKLHAITSNASSDTKSTDPDEETSEEDEDPLGPLKHAYSGSSKKLPANSQQSFGLVNIVRDSSNSALEYFNLKVCHYSPVLMYCSGNH